MTVVIVLLLVVIALLAIQIVLTIWSNGCLTNIVREEFDRAARQRAGPDRDEPPAPYYEARGRG